MFAAESREKHVLAARAQSPAVWSHKPADANEQSVFVLLSFCDCGDTTFAPEAFSHDAVSSCSHAAVSHESGAQHRNPLA